MTAVKIKKKKKTKEITSKFSPHSSAAPLPTYQGIARKGDAPAKLTPSV